MSNASSRSNSRLHRDVLTADALASLQQWNKSPTNVWHRKQWFWKRAVSINCVDREAAANHVLQTLQKNIWCFHSPLQQWLHGPETSVLDLQRLSLNYATYNSQAWLRNNPRIWPNKNMRHMRWEYIPTTRTMRRVHFSDQWAKVPPLTTIILLLPYQ